MVFFKAISGFFSSGPVAVKLMLIVVALGYVSSIYVGYKNSIEDNKLLTQQNDLLIDVNESNIETNNFDRQIHLNTLDSINDFTIVEKRINGARDSIKAKINSSNASMVDVGDRKTVDNRSVAKQHNDPNIVSIWDAYRLND